VYPSPGQIRRKNKAYRCNQVQDGSNAGPECSLSRQVKHHHEILDQDGEEVLTSTEEQTRQHEDHLQGLDYWDKHQRELDRVAIDIRLIIKTAVDVNRNNVPDLHM
jgi:hypothetical protein